MNIEYGVHERMKEAFRRLTNEHKETVLKMVERIWDGEDYTKIVYDPWVHSEKNPFYGLWIDDRLVGIGRLQWLTDHDVWLEGLKKDPDCRIHGIGKRFVRFYLDILRKEKDLRSIRFSTYFGNTESIRLNTKLGFRQTHTFSNLVCDTDERLKPVPGVERYSGDANALIDVFEKSTFYRAMDGFLTQGWVFFPASRETLRQFIENGEILIVQSDADIEGAILLNESAKEKAMNILSVAAETDAIRKKLFLGALHLTMLKGLGQMAIMCPEYPEMLDWLRSFGFFSWDRDHDVYLYEYPLDKL